MNYRPKFVAIFIFATMAAMTAVQVKADIIFDFNNNTAFDNSAAGTVATADDGAGGPAVTLTSVGVFAPEFEEDANGVFSLTGNTVAGTTSIGTNTNAIGVNNPTIGNGDFETFKGNTSGTEGTDFNFGESWVIEFDTDVTIDEFDFSSVDGDGSFDVFIEGNPTAFSFPDGATGDDFADPFSGLVIAAGTDITFTVNDVNQDASVRITDITVSIAAVPEPTSFAILGLIGLGVSVRRRR